MPLRFGLLVAVVACRGGAGEVQLDGTVGTDTAVTPTVPTLPTDPTGPVFVNSWGGQGTAPGQFIEPSSVELDSSGLVVVAGHEDRIQRFTRDGKLFDIFGEPGTGNGQFDHPHGLAIDRLRGDLIYVGDQENDRLQVFDADGGFVRQWGDAGFQHIHDVGIDRATGDLFVGDYELHTLRRFGPDGTLLAEHGGPGTGNGQFDGVWGVSTDSAGAVYVADRYNRRVQKLAGDGTFLAAWTGHPGGPFVKPTGVYVDENDVVYVCDSKAALVLLFDPDGQPLATWNINAITQRVTEPEDLVIDVVTGDIFLGEVFEHTVLHLRLQD